MFPALRVSRRSRWPGQMVLPVHVWIDLFVRIFMLKNCYGTNISEYFFKRQWWVIDIIPTSETDFFHHCFFYIKRRFGYMYVLCVLCCVFSVCVWCLTDFIVGRFYSLIVFFLTYILCKYFSVFWLNVDCGTEYCLSSICDILMFVFCLETPTATGDLKMFTLCIVRYLFC